MRVKMRNSSAVVDVPDSAAQNYLRQGWIKVGDSAHPEPAPLQPPPQSGKGSGQKVWAKYKQDLGIAEPDDPELTRDELVERIAARGFEV